MKYAIDFFSEVTKKIERVYVSHKDFAVQLSEKLNGKLTEVKYNA